MKPNEFKCDICEGIFEKGWTEEDALKEMEQTHGYIAPENRGVVCNQCYEEYKPLLDRPVPNQSFSE